MVGWLLCGLRACLVAGIAVRGNFGCGVGFDGFWTWFVWWLPGGCGFGSGFGAGCGWRRLVCGVGLMFAGTDLWWACFVTWIV